MSGAEAFASAPFFCSLFGRIDANFLPSGAILAKSALYWRNGIDYNGSEQNLFPTAPRTGTQDLEEFDLKQLLTGNEAVARAVWESGVRFAAAYPGTPSTEILENLAQYKDMHAEWAPNEKVAVEAAIGASIAGGRSFASMKHVGVNVAADPIFTFAYTGVGGGAVIVTADEPGMYSSQNEQDNRNYAKAAKIPMLEPSDSQECPRHGQAGLRAQREI
jgi:hypothetical protein